VLAGIVAKLDRIPLTSNPRTSFNVGLFEGGVSVNTIAPRAEAVIDMRSADPSSLARLSDQVEEVVREFAHDEIDTTIEVLGERPSGSLSPDSRIIAVARSALARLGIDAIFDASSTDANIPISRGIPGICIRLTQGGNDHREDEYIETAPLVDGLAQLVLVVDQLSRDLAAGKITSLALERP
jgi:acetylornithine deacetylase/succinyl-diaminopimelate desuccinylase-like protein